MADLFVYDHNDPKLTETEIYANIISVAPKFPDNHFHTGKGYIFKFFKDTDVNFIFTSYATSFFTSKKLSVSLSVETQKQRNIYIPDPPMSLLNYYEQQFISDIRARYAINILSFKKFKSNKTNRNYFVFTPYDNTVTKRLTDIGSIILFNQELPIQAKLGAQPNRGTTGSPLPQPVHQARTHSLGQQKVNNNPHQNGPALSAHSEWGNNQRSRLAPGSAPGPSVEPGYGINISTPHYDGTTPAVIPKYGLPPQQLVSGSAPGSSATPGYSPNSSTPHYDGTTPSVIPKYGLPPQQLVSGSAPGSSATPGYSPNSSLPIYASSGPSTTPKYGNTSYQQVNSYSPNHVLPVSNDSVLHPGTNLQHLSSTYYGPQQNDNISKLFSYNLCNMVESLNYGFKDPQTFVMMFNQTLLDNCLPPIKVSQHVIEYSKHIYNCNQASNNSVTHSPSNHISTPSLPPPAPISQQPIPISSSTLTTATSTATSSPITTATSTATSPSFTSISLPPTPPTTATSTSTTPESQILSSHINSPSTVVHTDTAPSVNKSVLPTLYTTSTADNSEPSSASTTPNMGDDSSCEGESMSVSMPLNQVGVSILTANSILEPAPCKLEGETSTIVSTIASPSPQSGSDKDSHSLNIQETNTTSQVPTSIPSAATSLDFIQQTVEEMIDRAITLNSPTHTHNKNPMQGPNLSPPPKPQHLEFFSSTYTSPLKLTISKIVSIKDFINGVRHSKKPNEYTPISKTSTPPTDRSLNRTVLFKDNSPQTTTDNTTVNTNTN